ncbi:MAG TPA: hypothetical protein [Caudoviricetes sp.]|nr:MAG TPA: hypothetical protein [Caudoviricetes sp.]
MEIEHPPSIHQRSRQCPILLDLPEPTLLARASCRTLKYRRKERFVLFLLESTPFKAILTNVVIANTNAVYYILNHIGEAIIILNKLTSTGLALISGTLMDATSVLPRGGGDNLHFLSMGGNYFKKYALHLTKSLHCLPVILWTAALIFFATDRIFNENHIGIKFLNQVLKLLSKTMEALAAAQSLWRRLNSTPFNRNFIFPI